MGVDGETTLEGVDRQRCLVTRPGRTRAELETPLRDEFSKLTWLLEPMLKHADLAIVDARYSDIYAEYIAAGHDPGRRTQRKV